MRNDPDLLLNVWEEVTRYADPSRASRVALSCLQSRLSLESLGLFCVHPMTGRLESLGSTKENPSVFDGRRIEWSEEDSLDLKQWHVEEDRFIRVDQPRFSRWADKLEAARRTNNEANPVPLDGEQRCWFGPLVLDEVPVGILVLVECPDRRLTKEEIRLAESVLAPLAVVVRHHQSQRESEMLREAVEADKRSLLTRLGRNKIADRLVGAESGLKAVFQRVELVARSDAPVLIFGETGTGKEVIAREIHQRSGRADGPFHRVNCGAIPPELIDSQLFGHEEGAFTGATETRKGWFERADGGTLFLDEIGELPPAAQVRLLRILQDGRLERVGGQKSVSVDVRIVAATHRDLVGMVGEGGFREDLWYRIAVFAIFLPPLRDRREDIPPMARHFAHRAATRFGLPLVYPTADDETRLIEYEWPGNVRELGTVIDRAAILGNGHCLAVAQALGITEGPVSQEVTGRLSLEREADPNRGFQNAPDSHVGLSGEAESLNESSDGVLSLDEAMCRHIEKALAISHGQVEGQGGAAALLQVNPHTLRARMRKLGIDWARFREKKS